MKPYYSDASVTLYHADCRDVLRDLAVVDHVLTDPPYDAETHAGARSSKHGADNGIGIDFDPLDVSASVPVLLAAARRWVIAFCAVEMLGEYRRVAGDAYVRGGFWRRHGTPQMSGDRPAQPGDGIAILHRPLSAGREGRTRWNGGGTDGFWECPVERKDRVHPTQKPEPLMAALLLAFTDEGETVIDPFCGSGTTLVAAKRLWRKAVGIEIEEKWCEAAAGRLAQGALFAEVG